MPTFASAAALALTTAPLKLSRKADSKESQVACALKLVAQALFFHLEATWKFYAVA
jgi:hypothetical protein